MPKKKSKKSSRSRSLESKKRRSRSRSGSNSYLRKTRKSRSKSPKKSREKNFKIDNELPERKIFNRSRSPDASKSRKRKKKSRSRSWARERNNSVKEDFGKKYRISRSPYRACKSRSRSRSRSYRKDLMHQKNSLRHKRYSRSRSFSSRSRSRSISKSKNLRAYSSTEQKYSKWEQNDDNYPIPTISSNLTQVPIDNQINQYQGSQYRIPYTRYNKNYMQSNYPYSFVQRQYLLNRQKSFQNLNQFGLYYPYMNHSQVHPINYTGQNEIINGQTENNREEDIKEESEGETEIVPSTDESEISSQCDSINENDLKLIKSELNLFDELFPADFCQVKNLIIENSLNENIKRLNGSESADNLFKYVFAKSLQNDSKKFDLVYSSNFFN